MDVKDLIARIRALPRYDLDMYSGCPCCDPTASMEETTDGDYVRHDDLDLILKEFEHGD